MLVVPKGSPADPWILTTARDFGARIVTNDRYRDWAEAHPEVEKPGFLVRGSLTGTTVWLEGMAEQPTAPANNQTDTAALRSALSKSPARPEAATAPRRKT